MARFLTLLRFTLTVGWCLSAYANPLPGTLSNWMHLEQHVNDRNVNGYYLTRPHVHHQNLEYRPESANWFDLKTNLIPESDLEIAAIESMIPEGLRSEFIKTEKGLKYYRLFIHP